MPYLIDGHNLIPKLGLRLEDPDDEMELVRLLQDFGRIRQQQVEVYFDGAPIGQAGTRKLGRIKAHFVRLGQTADAAIRKRLESMGKESKNWTVVSSDHEVQRSARTYQAQFIRSEDFVKQLRTALTASPSVAENERGLSPKEVQDWLNLFNNDDHE